MCAKCASPIKLDSTERIWEECKGGWHGMGGWQVGWGRCAPFRTVREDLQGGGSAADLETGFDEQYLCHLGG